MNLIFRYLVFFLLFTTIALCKPQNEKILQLRSQHISSLPSLSFDIIGKDPEKNEQKRLDLEAKKYIRPDDINNGTSFQPSLATKVLSQTDSAYMTSVNDQHFNTEFFKLKEGSAIRSYNPREIFSKETSLAKLPKVQSRGLTGRHKRYQYEEISPDYHYMSECLATTVTKIVPAYDTVYDVTEVLTSYFTRQTIAVSTVNHAVRVYNFDKFTNSLCISLYVLGNIEFYYNPSYCTRQCISQRYRIYIPNCYECISRNHRHCICS
ncbi:hypothetical protein BD560DRAFT_492973 [Blakeslea trispora]|nr:hypothetical protein BD560DRAFT_492973 [Blakeslea trispora]